MVLNFIGSKATSLRNRLVDKVWEHRLGVRTCGNVLIHQPDANLYGTFAYSSIMRILRKLDWTGDDVFVDIGCGKGRVCCCAALFPGRKVVGVDLDEDLCRQARLNAKRLRNGKTPIEIIHAKAQDLDYQDGTKFFMFHPFGRKTLALVIEAIQHSLARNPRQIQMVYLNPVHEAVLEQAHGFRRYDHIPSRVWGGLKFDASYWTWGRFGD